ncbi:MAG: hypothetical protein ACREMY_28435, partial [bacterium]
DCSPRVTRFQALEQQRFRALWDAIEAESGSERLAPALRGPARASRLPRLKAGVAPRHDEPGTSG